MSELGSMTAMLKEARLAQAAQLDAVLGLRDVKALRLDALQAALAPLIAEHAVARALFDLNVQPGNTPRLWIDLISSVVMEPNARTYRLVQDHDGQRVMLFETTDLNEMAQFVTKYLAHRIVMHEKLAAGVKISPGEPTRHYQLADLIYVWFTGSAFGAAVLLVAAMLMGKLRF